MALADVRAEIKSEPSSKSGNFSCVEKLLKTIPGEGSGFAHLFCTGNFDCFERGVVDTGAGLQIAELARWFELIHSGPVGLVEPCLGT